MTPMRRWTLALAVAACAAGGLGASGVAAAGGPLAPAGEPVRIGVAGPVAGPHAHMRQQVWDAAQVAVGEWNARGGIDGRPILLVSADDRQDPREAVEAARRLVAEGVLGVVGHIGTETTLAAAATYAAAGVLHMAPAATSPRLTRESGPTLFRVCGRDDDQGRVAAAFAAGDLGARRAAVLHDGSEYGAGLAAAFRQAFARRVPGGIVATGELPAAEREAPSVVARVRDAEPEVIFFGGLPAPAGQLRRALWQAGIRAPFVSGDAAADPEFVRAAGEGAAADSYLTFAPDVRALPSAQAFLLIHARLVGPPGPYSVYGYDAANALLTGLARAARSGRLEGLRAARALRARPYDGALGRLRWDPRGDLTVPLYVVYRTERGGPLQGWFTPVTGGGGGPPPPGSVAPAGAGRGVLTGFGRGL